MRTRWLCLAFALAWNAGACAEERPVLGVLKFQDETGAMFLQGGVGRALTNMLTNELAARPEFSVVERQKLNAVLEEQALSQSGRITPGEGAQIGRLTGAQFLVTGTVTAFEENAETKVKGGMFGGGKVERVSKGGYLAVDLRVIDTTSGEIAYARTVEGRTEGGSTSVGREGGMDVAMQASNALGSRAARAAVIEIIDYLVCALVQRDACLEAFAEKDRQRLEQTRKAAKFR